MSKKDLLDRHCVRCNKDTATPYIRNNLDLVYTTYENVGRDQFSVLDVGCGNGRNSEAVKQHIRQLQGESQFNNILSFDMVDDYGYPIQLGAKKLPLFKKSVDVVLANYVFMFLSRREQDRLLADIKRAARPGCLIILELYPAKDSNTPDKESMLKLQMRLFDRLGWPVVKYSQGKFIARKTR